MSQSKLLYSISPLSFTNAYMYLHYLQRSTTPNDHAHLPRPVSRCSSDSLEALKLSTTFIHTLQEGGVAKGEGLEAGLVVHMINGASILRCSPDEISKLLRQW